jgi:hypothetical protein
MSTGDVNEGGEAGPLPSQIDITLTAGVGAVNFTPYALARTSDDFFQSSEAYTSKAPTFNYFMRCASIELAFKSAILSTGNSDATKVLIKSLGHDLERAHATFIARFPEQLTPAEVDAIKIISPYFKSKGLEYTTADVIEQLMKGLSGFPDYELVRSASAKLNAFLRAKSFFIDV